MGNNSRIRFNPVTKEIEVEGTEQFVKTYFAKLQAMLSGASEKKAAIKERTESRKGTSFTGSLKRLQRRHPAEKRITNLASVHRAYSG